LRDLLIEEVAVEPRRTSSRSSGVGFSVDEEQVWTDVAVAVSLPFAGERVVAIAILERLVRCPEVDRGWQIGLDCFGVFAGLNVFVVF
jgi:hypothetical protein